MRGYPRRWEWGVRTRLLRAKTCFRGGERVRMHTRLRCVCGAAWRVNDYIGCPLPRLQRALCVPTRSLQETALLEELGGAEEQMGCAPRLG